MRPMKDEQCGQGHNTRDEQNWIYTQEHLGPNLVLFLSKLFCQFQILQNVLENFASQFAKERLSLFPVHIKNHKFG